MPEEKVFFRLANIGYYGVKYIFPSELNARLVASDGRPLPTEEITDTVIVLPGERYEVFVQLGQNQQYPLIAEHFNLNTQLVESSQELTIHTSLAWLENNGYLKEWVYPNPTEGLVFWKKQQGFQLKNAVGCLLLSGLGNELDLTDFQAGLYYLCFDNGKEYKVLKN
jgi:hypothetical protein